MDNLTIFGLFAVSAMMICYALEDRSRWYVLGFAGACVLGSIYGFLQGGLAVRIGGGSVVAGGAEAVRSDLEANWGGVLGDLEIVAANVGTGLLIQFLRLTRRAGTIDCGVELSVDQRYLLLAVEG